MERRVITGPELSRDSLVGIFGSLLIHGIVAVLAIIIPYRTSQNRLELFRPYQVEIVTMEEFEKGSQQADMVAPRGEKTRNSSLEAVPSPVIPVYQVKKIRVNSKILQAPEETALEPAQQETAVPEKDKNAIAEKKGKPSEWQKLIPEVRPLRFGKPITQRVSVRTSKKEGEYALARRLYYSEVWRAIQKQWALPVELIKRGNLEAIIIIRVRRDGQIVSMKFEKKSGNRLFDESAWKAVQKANPLPPFPEVYSPPYEEIGIRFRPENLFQRGVRR